MGFTTGFTGGVTLTLGVTYLTILAHQRNREAQGQSLRAQSHVLNSIVEPVVQPPPPTRSELAAAKRANLAESAKDRWNHEVENAARWIQRTDWDEVREGLEENVAKLWVKAFSGAAEGAKKTEVKVEEKAVPAAKDALESAKTKATAVAVEEKQSVSANAKTAWQRAKEKTQAAAADAAAAAETKAAEAKSVVAAVVEKGVETGQVLAGKAKTAVGLVEDKVEVKADGKILPATSAVEKALHQRYEKPNGLNQTVKEALSARYKPLDQRDNSVLRGL